MTTQVTDTVITQKTATPTEVIQKLLKGVYTLYYRAGNNPYPMNKNFYSTGANLRETVDIAKKHCEIMGIRFTRVVPFITDLRNDERQHTGLNSQEGE